MNFVPSFVRAIESTGTFAPWLFVGIFLAASALLIWRLEALSTGGFEGTVLGTLIMPYCSGIGNLAFAFILGRSKGLGSEVMTNSLVNNVTNMTLIIGLPALIWGLRVLPASNAGSKPPSKHARKSKVGDKSPELNRLSLLLTLVAVLFFTGALWALSLDGRLNFTDGLVLVGLFLFWQCVHVFEVLKKNVQQNKSFGFMVAVNLVLLGIGAFATYVSIEWLVHWISGKHTGFISVKYLGWLSGWLMVLPNAILAFYYAWRRQPEIVYTSQVGDCHICIPLCVGIFCLFQPMGIPPSFQAGILVLAGATIVHIAFVAVIGGLPKFMGWVLTAAYGVFLYLGLFKG